MTFDQTVDYLYSKLPMFTRIGAVALKKDLHNTLAMCEALGNPHQKFKSVHVGGTNGKGSTSHMLAAILQQAGYRTGLYTSPHLKDFRERIKINGRMIPKSFVTRFVKEQEATISAIEPSFFEATVAMAFDYFATAQVDIAVIEVGLGGKLDSTNVIKPEVSVITNISLDHTQILGDTLVEIAQQKAGIIKAGIAAVIGEKQEETASIFIDQATLVGAPINFAEDMFHLAKWRRNKQYLEMDVADEDGLLFPSFMLDLTGTYQLKNCITVLATVAELREKGFDISDEAIYQGLRNVKKLTGLQGRWQTIQLHPLVICDTGHNKAGIGEVLSNIRAQPHAELHMVIGMVKDKDVDSILRLLPKEAIYYFCQPQLERALPVEELVQKAKRHQLVGSGFGSVLSALDAAKDKASKDDLIFVGGSTFVVAEIL